MKTTNVFLRNYQSTKRVKVNEGGTRSSKTFSIAQLMVLLLCDQSHAEPLLITVCRKTLPALKSTAMRDFKAIMQMYRIWREELFNKSELVYKMGRNEIEFISVDQPLSRKALSSSTAMVSVRPDLYICCLR